MNRRNWFKSAVATVGSLLGISVLPKRANCVEVDGKEYPILQFVADGVISNLDELFGDKEEIVAYLPKYRAVYMFLTKDVYIYGLVKLRKLKPTTLGYIPTYLDIIVTEQSRYFQISKPYKRVTMCSQQCTQKNGIFISTFNYNLVSEKL